MPEGPFFRLSQLAGLEQAKKLVGGVDAHPGVQAVLFYGRSGSGLTSCAMALAHAWMCPRSSASGPCGDCPVCRSIDTGRAVDLQIVQPWGAQSLIKLSSINEPRAGETDPYSGVPARTFLRTRPLIAASKVMVFESAERMNTDAANALLKTLEEPTQASRLILVSSEFGAVLPTLRSRCLCVLCQAPSPENLHPFAETFGEQARIEAAREPYDALLAALDRFSSAPGALLALSQAARSTADALAKATGRNARSANAEVVRCIALYARRRGLAPQVVDHSARAHRQILGNGSPGIVFDSLFATMTSG